MTPHTSKCRLCNETLSPHKYPIFDTRFGVEGAFNIGRCESCGTVQLVCAPSPSDLKKLYETYYNFGGKDKGLYSKITAFFFTSLLYRIWTAIDGDICFYLRSGTGKLLDLGCNEGRGLLIYKKNGFTAEGIEINEVAAREAQLKGFKVFTLPLEEFDPGYKYDVIVLSHVIEHALDPDEMLSKVNQLLKPGGELWVSCPNIKSWQRSVFGRFWINWHVPFHVVFYSDRTLRTLLNRNGFDVVKSTFSSPALWIAQSIIAFVFAKMGKKNQAQRKPLLLGFLMIVTRLTLFPVLWIANVTGHGDCLALVARKK